MKQVTRYKLVATATSIGLFLSLCLHFWIWISNIHFPKYYDANVLSSESFRLACDGIDPGVALADALVDISPAMYPSHDTDIHSITVEGGDGFFPDICTVEYTEDYRVKAASWMFGDD